MNEASASAQTGHDGRRGKMKEEGGAGGACGRMEKKGKECKTEI